MPPYGTPPAREEVKVPSNSVSKKLKVAQAGFLIGTDYEHYNNFRSSPTKQVGSVFAQRVDESLER
jgi:hypothetical protein